MVNRVVTSNVEVIEGNQFDIFVFLLLNKKWF